MNDNQMAQFQDLLDKKACEEVILRYARTLDWLDEEGQASCYWPDAHIDYGFYEGDAAGWIPVVMEIERSSVRRWHICTGIQISIEGDTAQAECYGLSSGTGQNAEGILTDTLFGGRYLDELERREGEWRISSRRYIADWVHSFPNGLADLARAGLNLHALDIDQPNNPLYRRF